MSITLPIDRISLGAGEVDVIGWHYAPHLPDNRPHRHTFYEVCLVGEYGSGQYLVEGTPYEIGPGDLFIARPGVVHQIRNHPGPLMELRWIDFTWRAHPNLEASRADDGGVLTLLRALEASGLWVVSGEQGAISEIWTSLHKLSAGSYGVSAVLQLNSLTVALIISIARAAGGSLGHTRERQVTESDAGARLVQSAVRFIEDNLGNEMDIASLSDHLCISPRHCSRLFREHMENSPAAYIADIRLEHAARLLRHTARSIKDIAQEVGIPDVAHLNRKFSRRFGLPPARYRRSDG